MAIIKNTAQAAFSSFFFFFFGHQKATRRYLEAEKMSFCPLPRGEALRCRGRGLACMCLHFQHGQDFPTRLKSPHATSLLITSSSHKLPDKAPSGFWLLLKQPAAGQPAGQGPAGDLRPSGGPQHPALGDTCLQHHLLFWEHCAGEAAPPRCVFGAG